MKRPFSPALFLVILGMAVMSGAFSSPAYAASVAGGGACPTAAQYLNPTTNTQVTLSSMGVTSCFYVAANGSDSNSGTSETSPWLHAPGMGSCSGTCASTTPAAGEGFIFRGGDTWGASTMPWTWTWAGTSASPIYLGVDNGWFSTSSWARPILDCQGSCSRQFSFGESGNFVQLDNFELRGIRSTAVPPAYGGVYAVNTHDISGTLGSSTHVKVSNNYMHGACIAADGPQQAVYIIGYPLGDTLSEEYLNVIDGSDEQFYTGGACVSVPSGYAEMCGICGGVGNIYQNYVGSLSNGIVIAGTAAVHDNIITGIGTSIDNDGGAGDDHENAFESNGDCGTLLYNNQVFNNQFSGLVLFQLDPNSGCSDYAFNNVLWNNNAPNGMQCYESGGGGSCYFFNNTAACGPTGNLSNECGRATGNDHGYFENNHFITSATGSGVIGGSSVTMTSNVTQSSSTASGQGYSTSEGFVYSPSSNSGSTVGAGTNVYSTFCATVAAANAAAGPACLGDTTYACSYSASSHSMSCPARTTNGRPQLGAWDAGAYEFAAASTVAAPTGLSAVVQ